MKYTRAFAHLGHDCSMAPDPDEIENHIPGDSLWSKIKRSWTKHILVNEKITKTKIGNMRSYGGYRKEIKRQLTHFPYTIHPLSNFKISWDIFMVVMEFIVIEFVALDVSFFCFPSTAPFISSTAFVIIRTISDLICCLDICVKFFTGYCDERNKEIVLSHKKIFLNYLKGRFFFDFVSSIPTHFDLIVDLRSTPSKFNALIALQGISLLKFLKMFNISKNLSNLSMIFNLDFYVTNICIIVMYAFLIWLGISTVLIYSAVYSWDSTFQEQYSDKAFGLALGKSLYNGALIFKTVSYGTMEPNNIHEVIVINVLWFVSQFSRIFFLARIFELIKAKTSSKVGYWKMVNQINEFTAHKQLPSYTRHRILKYYEYHFQNHYFLESEIHKTISGQLRQDIIIQTCRHLVESVYFFRQLPSNLLVRIVSCLKPEIFLTNDLILKAGTKGQCMYFISTGTVAIYTQSGKEICHLEDGAYFGEIALVVYNARRVASVVAAEICLLYKLDSKDFMKAIHPYPDLLEKMQKIALDRAEKTTILEEYSLAESERNKQ